MSGMKEKNNVIFLAFCTLIKLLTLHDPSLLLPTTLSGGGQFDDHKTEWGIRTIF